MSSRGDAWVQKAEDSTTPGQAPGNRFKRTPLFQTFGFAQQAETTAFFSVSLLSFHSALTVSTMHNGKRWLGFPACSAKAIS
jgi:hypothetical protein